jgi:hypothetical protein
MSARSSRRWAAGLSLLLLLAIVLPPLISVGRFRGQITTSLSRALGRNVAAGAIRLRVLPRPGLILEEFVVDDDPSFGAEPMLRAREVSAALRLSSLWRGRLEIASLGLVEPSLNLVRRGDGRWNLETLLARNASIPSAPTGRHKPEARPRFPYVEADNGRINFKIGSEKMVYCFTDADFALWLEAENKWSLRLEARPVRTDANLSDTGRLKLTGWFERAPSVHETPFRLNLEIERAQLGQLSRLIYGRDRGWRGTLDVAARLEGTPASFAVRSDSTLDEFRRYDIFSKDPLKLAVHCSAQFSTDDASWSEALCTAPVAGGLVTVSGSGRGVLAVRQYDVKLVAQHVPMSALAAAARRAKKDLPGDLTARGDFNGIFLVSKTDSPATPAAVWAGGGQTRDFTLVSEASGGSLELGTIPFTIPRAAQPALRSPFSPVRTRTPRVREDGRTEPLQIAVGPFAMPLGPDSATVTGKLSRAGYDLDLEGEGDLPHLFQVARSLGLRTFEPNAKGSARFKLEVAGGWTGFAAPTVTGTAELSGVSARVRGIFEPLEINSASLALAPDVVTVRELDAGFPETAVHFTGSLELARHCGEPGPCAARIDLHADELSSAEVNRLINPQSRKRAWYGWLENDDGPVLGGVRAAGRFSVGRLAMGNVTANNVMGRLEVERGKFRFGEVRAELWGGKHDGEWLVDFTGARPAYAGSGVVTRASLAQMRAALGNDIGSGNLSFNYRLATAGWRGQEMISTLKATAHLELRDAVLHRIALDGGAGPLRARHFSGRLAFNEAAIQIAGGKLQAGGSIYDVSGTAHLDRSLDIQMVRDSAHAYTITGTLAAPRVQPRPQTEASLKP